MNEFGENWCEGISKSIEVNATTLDYWSIDVKCEEEPYNLQGQSLSQQNLIDYPPTQHNANVNNVELGLIPLRNNLQNLQSHNGDPSAQPRQRKPRITWSVEEHMLFLSGLQMYGLSWKRISQDIVRTKTPSQLASHAQKYFKRQKMLPSQRKRKSIHDITLPLNFYPPPDQDLSMQDIQCPTPLQDLSMQYTPVQDFSMQDIQVPTPVRDFSMQYTPVPNVNQPAYTPVQDLSMQDIQGPTPLQDLSMQYTPVQDFSMQDIQVPTPVRDFSMQYTPVPNVNQPAYTPVQDYQIRMVDPLVQNLTHVQGFSPVQGLCLQDIQGQ